MKPQHQWITTNSLNAVRRGNWQRHGHQAVIEDNTAYKDSVENMISLLKQSVTSEHYGMDMNLSILGINQTYGSIRASFKSALLYFSSL